MIGIIGVVAFLTVLALSILITGLATSALSMTGLSREAARFQARSAFTGTGFTTREAEKVVSHPVRRRIIMWLMIARSAGLITIIISLILSFATSGTYQQRLWRLIFLVGGVLILWGLTQIRFFMRLLSRFIDRALQKWTDLDTRDYYNLLHISEDYKVTELQVQEGDWVAGKKLKNCHLAEEGITVLGIYREDGSYVGAPRGNSDIFAGDTLILYGRAQILSNLDKRRSDFQGQKAHEEAISEQKKEEARQDIQEEQYRREKENSGQ
ncbi:MAG: TrkA C-terminal domain-containing protein [Candidatus Aminicenantes bacterium]